MLSTHNIHTPNKFNNHMQLPRVLDAVFPGRQKLSTDVYSLLDTNTAQSLPTCAGHSMLVPVTTRMRLEYASRWNECHLMFELASLVKHSSSIRILLAAKTVST